MEIALDPLLNRTGDVWHACVASLRDVSSLCYGWRADADISWDAGNRFHPGWQPIAPSPPPWHNSIPPTPCPECATLMTPSLQGIDMMCRQWVSGAGDFVSGMGRFSGLCNAGQVMLDPYAPVAVKVNLPEGINVPPPSKGLAPVDPQTNPPALMGCLSSLVDGFDWEGTSSPETPLSRTLVVEIDVPSFSGNPSVSASNRGEGTKQRKPRGDMHTILQGRDTHYLRHALECRHSALLWNSDTLAAFIGRR
jgi:hypothetical protein